MSDTKLNPWIGNGRAVGRWLGSIGLAVERAGLWIQRHGDELRWADRPHRDNR